MTDIGDWMREKARREEQKRDAQRPSAASCSTAGFNYVDIATKGCEGWLNLFFGEHCVSMINDVDLANQIRSVTAKRSR